MSDNNKNQPIKAVNDSGGSFKGGLGAKAITPIPVAKIPTPSKGPNEVPAPPIKKGLGASQVTPIAAPQRPQIPQAPPNQASE